MSRLWAAAAVVVLGAVPAFFSGSSVASLSRHDATHCGYRALRVVIAGRVRCLDRGVTCRARFNPLYHRYLFDCHNGYLVYRWTGLLARPLHIPAIAAGSACPAIKQSGTLDDRGAIAALPAFGPGPAYPTLESDGGRAALTARAWGGFEGWYGNKVLWTVPRYNGPYIVRGRQLDGQNEIRLDWGPQWTDLLNIGMRLVGPYSGLNPAATFLPGPGCYAYQVDGRGFSYLIIFQARIAA